MTVMRLLGTTAGPTKMGKTRWSDGLAEEEDDGADHVGGKGGKVIRLALAP